MIDTFKYVLNIGVILLLLSFYKGKKPQKDYF